MELDAEQKHAVEFYEGEAIVIAGAGSGKTKTATMRIARLIERGEKPESILAFTFTNAAADEMKSRLIGTIGDANVAMLNIGTMHSQMNKILRKNIHLWRPHFYKYEIMDEYGARVLVKDAMKECGLPENDLVNFANALKMVSTVKNQTYSMEQVCREGVLDEELKKLGVSGWFKQFFESYEGLRHARKLVGFDDMLWDTYFLLREKVNILNTYAQAFKFILVDEFQDTNQVQFEIVRMLQSHYHNLFVVCDPRQSVYGFRGAEVKLSLEFKQHFPNAELIELQHNYRCVSNVVDMSNDLIGHAGYPFKPTKSMRESGKIGFLGCFIDDNEEAAAVIEEIRQLNVDGTKWSEIVVLSRTNAQSRPLEEKLVKAKIPYVSVEGSFYESANVKDMMCYLKLSLNDDMEAFKRIYNRPNRFLGKVFFEDFESKMTRGSRGIIDTLGRGGFSKQYMDRSASALAFQLTVLRKSIVGLSAGKAIELIRKMFEYDAWLKKNDLDAQNRIEILNELMTSALDFTEIKEYIEFVDMIVQGQKKGEDFDAVRLMTIHRSKGLESPVVFVTGVSEGVLPHARAEDTDEERRLCYVAVTRAVDRLYVSYFLTRFKKTLAPSPYLTEMLLEHYSGEPVLFSVESSPVDEPLVKVA